MTNIVNKIITVNNVTKITKPVISSTANHKPVISSVAEKSLNLETKDSKISPFRFAPVEMTNIIYKKLLKLNQV
jgi:hypothetical protein